MPWMVFAGDEGVGFEGPLSPNVEAFLRTADLYVGARKPQPARSLPPVEMKTVLVPKFIERRVPRLINRQVPRQRCRIINGRQICETYYENVIETIYETKYVEVSQ